MAKIFTIVLTWNNFFDTAKCLEGLLKQADLKVVLVDNHSTDNSILKIKKRYFNNKNLIILKNNKNLGFAGGNNIGIKYALSHKADYIFLLNNDTKISPNTILKLKNCLENNLKAAVAVPKIYLMNSKKIWYAGGKISFLIGGSIHNFKNNYINEIDFATGAAMMIKTKILKKVGLFDERFFAYNEDTDLSWRITNAGFKIIYVSGAIVWHKAGGSFGVRTYKHLYYDSRNKILFMKKNSKFYQYIVFLPVLIGKNLLRNLIGAIVAPRPNKWGRVRGAALGIWHGIVGKYGQL